MRKKIYDYMPFGKVQELTAKQKKLIKKFWNLEKEGNKNEKC